jgi:hypothetical protein
MRLAMGGQAIEAMAVLRVGIEQGWYALHIANDPAAPTRAQIWWKRDENPQATKACQNEFTIANVRGTHEALDATTAIIVNRLYKDTIAYGAHPNWSGVALGLSVEQMDAETATIRVGILNPIPMTMLSTIKAAVDVAMGLALTFGLIYGDAFKRAGLGRDFNLLRQHAADVFKERARLLRIERPEQERGTAVSAVILPRILPNVGRSRESPVYRREWRPLSVGEGRRRESCDDAVLGFPSWTSPVRIRSAAPFESQGLRGAAP